MSNHEQYGAWTTMPPRWRAIFTTLISQWRHAYPDDQHTEAELYETVLQDFVQREVICQMADGTYRFPSLRDAAAMLGDDV
jgi:hypothetical protein